MGVRKIKKMALNNIFDEIAPRISENFNQILLISLTNGLMNIPIRPKIAAVGKRNLILNFKKIKIQTVTNVSIVSRVFSFFIMI